MVHENDHAFAAGYEGNRAVRTWLERMKILEDNGFIHAVRVGNQRYGYVAIVHPTSAIQDLRNANRIPENWWNAYLAVKRETKETTHEQREAKKLAVQRVVPIVPGKKALADKKVRSK